MHIRCAFCSSFVHAHPLCMQHPASVNDMCGSSELTILLPCIGCTAAIYDAMILGESSQALMRFESARSDKADGFAIYRQAWFSNPNLVELGSRTALLAFAIIMLQLVQIRL